MASEGEADNSELDTSTTDADASPEKKPEKEPEKKGEDNEPMTETRKPEER